VAAARKGFLVIRGHFCQPYVYEGRPFAVVLAQAATITVEASATTTEIARSFALTPG